MKLLGSSQLLPNLYLQQPTTTTLRDGSFVCCQVVDVDRLFTNMETVCEVSAALLHRLHEAIAEPDKEAVVIGNRRSPFDLDRPNPLSRFASYTSFPLCRGSIHPGKSSVGGCVQDLLLPSR